MCVCMYVSVCVEVMYLYVSGLGMYVYVLKICYQHDVTDVERTMYYEGCGIPILLLIIMFHFFGNSLKIASLYVVLR